MKSEVCSRKNIIKIKEEINEIKQNNREKLMKQCESLIKL